MGALKIRLAALMSPPENGLDIDEATAAAIEAKLTGQRVRLIEALTHPEVVCRNGLIADANPVICGSTGANAVIYSLGAGAGMKHHKPLRMFFLYLSRISVCHHPDLHSYHK